MLFILNNVRIVSLRDPQALRVAVEVLGQRMAVYPVKTLQLLAPDKKGRGPFVECLLVKKGTT